MLDDITSDMSPHNVSFTLANQQTGFEILVAFTDTETGDGDRDRQSSQTQSENEPRLSSP